MNNRVKQVLSALTAHITEQDLKLIAKYLDNIQTALFWRMNLPDQRHALNVAYSAIEMAANRPDVNVDLLVKCALLHDVGKVKGDVSTIDKILTVILDKLAPRWAIKWGREGQGNTLNNFRHAVYIYYNHASRGASMLLTAGIDSNIANIVAKHHEAPAVGEPPELTLLRAADSLH